MKKMHVESEFAPLRSVVLAQRNFVYQINLMKRIRLF